MQSVLAVHEQGAGRREWLVLSEGCNEAHVQQERTRRASID